MVFEADIGIDEVGTGAAAATTKVDKASLEVDDDVEIN